VYIKERWAFVPLPLDQVQRVTEKGGVYQIEVNNPHLEVCKFESQSVAETRFLKLLDKDLGAALEMLAQSVGIASLNVLPGN